NPHLEGVDVIGYFAIGAEPEKDEQRLALRGPIWGGEGLLGLDVDEGRSCSGRRVSALRMRHERPEIILTN
ncbi:MAG: hypothetical protein KKC05_03500, partial [Nanoarchaeota archaeon]|nr:hypothetical protein [Nanoarchaeota archaeon]